jgi:hypothetical protein
MEYVEALRNEKVVRRLCHPTSNIIIVRYILWNSRRRDVEADQRNLYQGQDFPDFNNRSGYHRQPQVHSFVMLFDC